jgi:hypothetical protein
MPLVLTIVGNDQPAAEKLVGTMGQLPIATLEGLLTNTAQLRAVVKQLGGAVVPLVESPSAFPVPDSELSAGSGAWEPPAAVASTSAPPVGAVADAAAGASGKVARATDLFPPKSGGEYVPAYGGGGGGGGGGGRGGRGGGGGGRGGSGGKGSCRFAERCTRADCHFDHPERSGGWDGGGEYYPGEGGGYDGGNNQTYEDFEAQQGGGQGGVYIGAEEESEYDMFLAQQQQQGHMKGGATNAGGSSGGGGGGGAYAQEEDTELADALLHMQQETSHMRNMQSAFDEDWMKGAWTPPAPSASASVLGDAAAAAATGGERG